jgi:hypothetical protein
MYTELLAFKLNLINYTQVSVGADSPYACDISANSFDGTPYQTPCVYDPDSAPSLANIIAPVLGVPSSFDYVESEGAPQQYYSLSNLISSLAPVGVSQASGGSSSSSTESGGVSCYNNNANPPQPTTDVPECSKSSDTPTCPPGAALCPSCTKGTLTCADGIVPSCTDGTLSSCPDSSTPSCTDGGDITAVSTTTQATPLCYANGNEDTSSPTVTCTDPKTGSTSSSTPTCLQGSAFNTNIPTGTAATIPSTYINSIIQGYLLVPYYYTYTMTQTWTPGAIIGPTGTYPTGTTCDPYQFSNPVTTPAQTIYTMSQVDLPSSNYLMDYIQGGDTYLEQSPYDQNYYIANLSNEGFPPVSPNSIDYNIYTNRWFGEMFINQTVAPAFTTPPYTLANALIVNAVNSDNYAEENFVQTAPGIAGGQPSYNGYYTQDMMTLIGTSPSQAAACSAAQTSCLSSCTSTSNPTCAGCQTEYTACMSGTNPTYGADCGSSCPSNYYYTYNPSLLYGGSSTLSYTNTLETQLLPIFQVFDKTIYLDNLGLSIEPNPPLGYNRLVYTFVDAFNNVITMPLDVDLANIASMTESASTVSDPSNANQVVVTVTGTLQYQAQTGMEPLADANVFIYYDTNLNYYNAIYSPTDTDPTPYFANALLCAFATGSSTCQLANPLSSLTQPGSTNPQTSGPAESQVVTFATQYNAIGQCDPVPTSLLALPDYNQCNIYGDYGLSAVDTNSKPTLYCLPVYMNGNGVFTSQLGLTNVVTTDANGNFIAQFTTCGSGAETITAEYYGAPGPEPVPVQQPPLQYSSNAMPSLQPMVTSNVLNYVYSPVSAATTVLIGSNILSFGSIGIALMLVLASALLLLFVRRLISVKKGRNA